MLQVGPYLVDTPGQLGLETQIPRASGPGSRVPPPSLLFPGPAMCHLQGWGRRPCRHTRLQSSRKLGRSLSVGWKLMRSE